MDTVLICVIIVLVVLLFACNSDLCDRTNKLVEGAKGFLGLSKLSDKLLGNDKRRLIKNSLKMSGVSNYPPSFMTMNQRDDTSRFGEGLAGNHTAGYAKERLAPSSSTAVTSFDKAARRDLYSTSNFTESPGLATTYQSGMPNEDTGFTGMQYGELLPKRMVGNDADFAVMEDKQLKFGENKFAHAYTGYEVQDALPNADMRYGMNAYVMRHGLEDYPGATHNVGDRAADNGPPVKYR